MVGKGGAWKAVKLQEFRKLVQTEFGDGLKHATPANVREFLDRIQPEIGDGSVTERLILDEPCNSYEEIIKDTFARILEMPSDEAVIALWTLALDLAFASIESQYAERFASLFNEMD